MHNLTNGAHVSKHGFLWHNWLWIWKLKCVIITEREKSPWKKSVLKKCKCWHFCAQGCLLPKQGRIWASWEEQALSFHRAPSCRTCSYTNRQCRNNINPCFIYTFHSAYLFADSHNSEEQLFQRKCPVKHHPSSSHKSMIVQKQYINSPLRIGIQYYITHVLKGTKNLPEPFNKLYV